MELALWIIGYFVVGLLVSILFIKYTHGYSDVFIAGISMLFWPLVLLVCGLFFIGWLVTFIAEHI